MERYKKVKKGKKKCDKMERYVVQCGKNRTNAAHKIADFFHHTNVFWSDQSARRSSTRNDRGHGRPSYAECSDAISVTRRWRLLV